MVRKEGKEGRTEISFIRQKKDEKSKRGKKRERLKNVKRRRTTKLTKKKNNEMRSREVTRPVCHLFSVQSLAGRVEVGG